MKWEEEVQLRLDRMPSDAKEMRKRAKRDLYYFACLVNPGYVYGSIHREVYRWIQKYSLFGDNKTITSNKLLMLPRAHLKSHVVATWCAWMIVRHPEITILYVSATAELAETQLYAIKNILSSDIFTRYFPEYVNNQEGLREKWTTTKVSIDHVDRRKQNIRDATIATAGLTTNTTGWHADIVVSDDLVVPENAYTEDGRETVSKKSSQFTSIRNAGGFTMACGTRYHPNDIYATWKDQLYDVYDDEGELVDKLPVWETKEYPVEKDGLFLWPRTVREDGKAFGFNKTVLSRIKAEYSDGPAFYAQYYNNPNESNSNRISRDKFQYFNPKFLNRNSGSWEYLGKRLNVYAAIDFAFSLEKTADYTAIVVIGLDEDNNLYVLDIERFRSNKIIDYFRQISVLHSRWGFKKLHAEISVAQAAIVDAIKDHIKDQGSTLSVYEHRPTRKEGSKEARIAAALEHRYDDMKVWHKEGGLTLVLEEELVQARPRHDDIKDALAAAVTIAVKPAKSNRNQMSEFMAIKPASRFGGI